MVNTNNKCNSRKAICFVTAVTLLQSNNVVNTFSQPQTSRCRSIPVSCAARLNKNGVSSKRLYNRCIDTTVLNASSDHISKRQDKTLQIGTGIDIDLELSEFIGLNVVSPMGTTSSSNVQPLFVSSTISDEQREFDLMLGKALDILRSDYPDMLTKSPNFSIYDPQIEVVDPKGITIHSIKSYKTSFQFLHMIINLFYCPQDSHLTFRLIYDTARKSIRVSWNAVLMPRIGGGNMNHALHVDGISVYEFDRKTGLINQHRVEHLLINDAPVEAPQGIFRAIANYATAGPDNEGIPVWNMKGSSHSGNISNVLEFKSNKSKNTCSSGRTSSLFSSTETASDGDFQHPLFDQEAFDRKNASRKKFGVPPLTPDEYVQLQAEVKAMESAQRQKSISSGSTTEMANTKESKGNILGKLFGNMMKDTCQSNFDCERPEVCCDLGFKKMCCSSGMRIFDPQPGYTPIPVPMVADDHMYPRGGPDGLDIDY